MRCDEDKRSDGTQEREVSVEVQMVNEEAVARRAKVNRGKVGHGGLCEGSNKIRFMDSDEVRERVEGTSILRNTPQTPDAPGRNHPFRGALVGLIID